jgi:hypothetical protein
MVHTGVERVVDSVTEHRAHVRLPREISTTNEILCTTWLSYCDKVSARPRETTKTVSQTHVSHLCHPRTHAATIPYNVFMYIIFCHGSQMLGEWLVSIATRSSASFVGVMSMAPRPAWPPCSSKGLSMTRGSQTSGLVQSAWDSSCQNREHRRQAKRRSALGWDVVL